MLPLNTRAFACKPPGAPVGSVLSRPLEIRCKYKDYCKEHRIHLNGPKLGKPYTDPAEAMKHKKLEWLESGERGEIKRHFGVGKRRYSLDCIVTKLKETSEAMIHSIVIYMNLHKKLRLLLCSLFSWFQMMIQNRMKEILYSPEKWQLCR